MKNVGSGYAASQVAINVNVIGIEDFGDVCNGGNRDAAFVDATFNGDVRMAIDDARHHELTSGIDDGRILRYFDGRADFGDFAILNKDRGVLKRAVRDGKNGGVLNQDDRTDVGRRRGDRKYRRDKQSGESCGKASAHRISVAHRASRS